jgi:SPX domain protein involved in polyphosphate accumulation
MISSNNNYRFERKWVFNNNFLDVYNNLLKSKFFFKEAFPNRLVNSIYFDDFNYTSVKENLEGDNDKMKIRLRWYGKNCYILKNPKLEIKIKKQFQNYKIIKKLDILNNLNIKNLKNAKFISETVNSIYNKKKIIPVSTTHYNRFYFISSNNLIRSTLDKNLSVSRVNNNIFIPVFRNFNKIILELKYSGKYDDYVRKNINLISSRYSKNSKYIYSMS